MATTATVVETQNPTEVAPANGTAAPPAPAESKAVVQPATEPRTTLLSDDKAAPTATETEVKPAGAPEKYEFTAPEGKTYDPQVLEEFSAAAREANLTQDAAQKLIAKMGPALATRQQAQIDAVHDQWAQASKTDKEFGGEKLQENLAVAKKALSTFATPELRTLLEGTALGNHPEILRMLYRVGKAISEDGFVATSQGPAAVKMGDFASLANALYPKKG